MTQKDAYYKLLPNETSSIFIFMLMNDRKWFLLYESVVVIWMALVWKA